MTFSYDFFLTRGGTANRHPADHQDIAEGRHHHSYIMEVYSILSLRTSVSPPPIIPQAVIDCVPVYRPILETYGIQ